MNSYTAWMLVNVARYAAVVGVLFVAYLFAKEKFDYGWLIFVGVILVFGGYSLKQTPDNCPYCGKIIHVQDVLKGE